VHRLAGEEEKARQAFTQAASGDPRPGYAHASLVALVEALAKVDEFQRGLIDYHAGSYGATVAAFRRYTEETPQYDTDAHYYMALSYLDAGSYDLAAQECELVLARYPSTIPHWGEMWLLLGEAHANRGLLDEAVRVYLEFADSFSSHTLAPQARWEAAHLLEREGRLRQAADIYTQLADAHVNADQAPEARFRAGLCRYRSGDEDGAIVAWQELVNGYPASRDSSRGRYWLGRTLWSQGEVEQAQALLGRLAENLPRDYYGLRAAHLLANGGVPPRWPTPPWQGVRQFSDDEAERAEAEQWLRTWTEVPEALDPGALSDTIAGDAHFRRAMELLTLGLRAEAQGELDSLRSEHERDPLSLYQLALTAQDLGLYATSLRSAIDLAVLAPEDSVLGMPRLIQRLAFPIHYAELVLTESHEYRVEPLLMFALIRQESVFDDTVASWAGAVGLAQIMPTTGEWIAEMMPWPDYSEELLRRAYLNVRFGTWFMSRILVQTDGDVAAALAGYNGGPANAMRWLEQSGGDPDLFVEVIHLDEPQRYVREIYRHYDVYVRLYGNGDR